MTEEEKEAIDKLSSKKNETTWNDTIRQIKREEITDVVVTRQKYITIILNLIKTLQKEIEDYKSGDFFTAKQMHRIDEGYIDKVKIIGKIEDLEEQKEELEQKDNGIGFTLNNFYIQLKAKIEVLKELLEEEK